MICDMGYGKIHTDIANRTRGLDSAAAGAEGSIPMTYNLNLGALSMAAYQKLLGNQNLLPGRRILLVGLEHNFNCLQTQQIDTVEQLKKALSTPARLARMAADTGISAEYLTVLRREVNSFEQTPVPLSAFTGIDPLVIQRLQAAGIHTSRDYYENGPQTPDELYGLCDLVRVNGIGAVAARAFYDAGYHAASDIAKGNAEEMLCRITAVNAEKQYYQAKLGLGDMQFCIDFAAVLMEYGG